MKKKDAEGRERRAGKKEGDRNQYSVISKMLRVAGSRLRVENSKWAT